MMNEVWTIQHGLCEFVLSHFWLCCFEVFHKTVCIVFILASDYVLRNNHKKFAY